MSAPDSDLVAAVGRVEKSLDDSLGGAAAQLAMSRLRELTDDRLAASIYRLWEDRLWLVAQAGHLTVFDGIPVDFGVVGRAIRMGATQRVTSGPLDPDWVQAAPDLTAQLVIPVGDHLVSLELDEMIDDEGVRALERFATRLVRQVRSGPTPTNPSGDVARSLVTMVGMSSADLIAEYALRLMARVAGLTSGRIVVIQEHSDPISVAWKTSGSDLDYGADTVLGVAEMYAGLSTAVIPDSDGADQMVVPLRDGHGLMGGILGRAPVIDTANARTAAVAAIAAHTVACLQRTALEASLKEAHRARGDFIASLSHELRTPLTAIVGYADILLGDGDTSELERTEFVSAIRDGARYVLDLVGDVLDVARSDAGRLTVDTSGHWALQPIVAEVIGLVAPQAAKNRVRVETFVADDVAVWGDETRVRQIIANLLSNAVKFTEDGTIGITARSSGDTVTITVRDDGEGIDPALMARLFRPFSGKSTDKGRAGTGLGLVISRRLAEAMGGSLDLESEGLGHGTAAILTLPAGGGGRAWSDPTEVTPSIDAKPG